MYNVHDVYNFYILLALKMQFDYRYVRIGPFRITYVILTIIPPIGLRLRVSFWFN